MVRGAPTTLTSTSTSPPCATRCRRSRAHAGERGARRTGADLPRLDRTPPDRPPGDGAPLGGGQPPRQVHRDRRDRAGGPPGLQPRRLAARRGHRPGCRDHPGGRRRAHGRLPQRTPGPAPAFGRRQCHETRHPRVDALSGRWTAPPWTTPGSTRAVDGIDSGARLHDPQQSRLRSDEPIAIGGPADEWPAWAALVEVGECPAVAHDRLARGGRRAGRRRRRQRPSRSTSRLEPLGRDGRHRLDPWEALPSRGVTVWSVGSRGNIRRVGKPRARPTPPASIDSGPLPACATAGLVTASVARGSVARRTPIPRAASTATRRRGDETAQLGGRGGTAATTPGGPGARTARG